MDFTRHILHLVDVVNAAKAASLLNTDNNANRFCDYCFRTIPLAGESLRVSETLDCCLDCKAECDQFLTDEQTCTAAHRIFRRSVLHNLERRGEAEGRMGETYFNYCGICDTFARNPTPMLTFHCLVCKHCIDQIRNDAKNQFSNMRPFQFRESESEHNKQLDAAHAPAKLDFDLFD